MQRRVASRQHWPNDRVDGMRDNTLKTAIHSPPESAGNQTRIQVSSESKIRNIKNKDLTALQNMAVRLSLPRNHCGHL
jgi:hypothetical protein